MELVVKSKVRDIVAGKGLQCGSDFLEELSHKLEVLVRDAMRRCVDNNRKTVGARDL